MNKNKTSHQNKEILNAEQCKGDFQLKETMKAFSSNVKLQHEKKEINERETATDEMCESSHDMG